MHIQLLSALLVMLSIGSFCLRGYPAAEHPMFPLQSSSPSRNCRESRMLWLYSDTNYFCQQELVLAFDFELTVNRQGSFRSGCVLQHLANDCLNHRYRLQSQRYKTSLCLLSLLKICIHKEDIFFQYNEQYIGIDKANFMESSWVNVIIIALQAATEFAFGCTRRMPTGRGSLRQPCTEQSLQYGPGQLECVGIHGCVSTTGETRDRE